MIQNPTFFVLKTILVLLLILNPAPTAAQQAHQFLFDQALQASKEGQFLDALNLWGQLLEVFPDDALAWSNQGQVRFALGDFEGAIADQTKSIEILPFEVDSHLNRGVAEEALELWEQAEIDYSWILERDENDAFALYNLANVRVAQEHWQEAEALFDKAALARPSFPMARSSKALSAYQLGELDQAQVELRSIIRRHPLFADARAALSALLWHQGLLGEAESHWAAASGLDSRYRDQNWLLNVRRWPPEPTHDLLAFLELESP